MQDDGNKVSESTPLADQKVSYPRIFIWKRSCDDNYAVDAAVGIDIARSVYFHASIVIVGKTKPIGENLCWWRQGIDGRMVIQSITMEERQ